MKLTALDILRPGTIRSVRLMKVYCNWCPTMFIEDEEAVITVEDVAPTIPMQQSATEPSSRLFKLSPPIVCKNCGKENEFIWVTDPRVPIMTGLHYPFEVKVEEQNLGLAMIKVGLEMIRAPVASYNVTITVNEEGVMTFAFEPKDRNHGLFT